MKKNVKDFNRFQRFIGILLVVFIGIPLFALISIVMAFIALSTQNYTKMSSLRT